MHFLNTLRSSNRRWCSWWWWLLLVTKFGFIFIGQTAASAKIRLTSNVTYQNSSVTIRNVLIGTLIILILLTIVGLFFLYRLCVSAGFCVSTQQSKRLLTSAMRRSKRGSGGGPSQTPQNNMAMSNNNNNNNNNRANQRCNEIDSKAKVSSASVDTFTVQKPLPTDEYPKSEQIDIAPEFSKNLALKPLENWSKNSNNTNASSRFNHNSNNSNNSINNSSRNNNYKHKNESDDSTNDVINNRWTTRTTGARKLKVTASKKRRNRSVTKRKKSTGRRRTTSDITTPPPGAKKTNPKRVVARSQSMNQAKNRPRQARNLMTENDRLRLTPRSIRRQQQQQQQPQTQQKQRHHYQPKNRGNSASQNKTVGPKTMVFNDGISFYKRILKSIHSVKSVSQYFTPENARK